MLYKIYYLFKKLIKFFSIKKDLYQLMIKKILVKQQNLILNNFEINKNKLILCGG